MDAASHQTSSLTRRSASRAPLHPDLLVETAVTLDVAHLWRPGYLEGVEELVPEHGDLVERQGETSIHLHEQEPGSAPPRHRCRRCVEFGVRGRCHDRQVDHDVTLPEFVDERRDERGAFDGHSRQARTRVRQAVKMSPRTRMFRMLSADAAAAGGLAESLPVGPEDIGTRRPSRDRWRMRALKGVMMAGVSREARVPERSPRAQGSCADFMLGDWLVRPSLNRISQGGNEVRLRPQLMDVLVCLATRAGRTVTKDELLESVWPGQYIVESGLARCVAELRQILGDATWQDSRYIETIPKRGYRLIAPVTFLAVEPAEAAVPSVGQGPSTSDTSGDAAVAASDLPSAAPDAAAPAAGKRRRRIAVAAAGTVLLAVAATLSWRFFWRPPIAERDQVVLTLENATGDAVFDDPLRLALLVQVEQSPYLRVVGEQRVREELTFMHLPADTPISRTVARDVCRRIGAKAVLAGSLAALGRHYVIGLEAVGCQSGDVLVRHQLEVEGKEAVLTGLGRAVSAIRRKLGESVASIRRSDVPIVRATTSSLDALEAFSLGDRARSRGDDDESVRLYRRAIALDPSFALAYVRLGVHLFNLRRNHEGVEALKAAYTLRDRASPPERLYISAVYEIHVIRDPVKAIEPLEIWRDEYPANPIARFSLASTYNELGRLNEAAVEAREALRLDPGNAIAGAALGQALIQLGRLEEARRLGAGLLARRPDSVLLHDLELRIAFLRGDREAVRRQLEWAAAVPAAERLFLEVQQGMAWVEGRADAAARLGERTLKLGERDGDSLLAARAMLWRSNEAAMLGATAGTTALVDEALKKARTAQTLGMAALALAWAGETDQADRCLREYRGMPDVGPGSDPDLLPAAMAAVALSRGRPDTAIDVLEPLRAYESGWLFKFFPAYIRGLALLRLGRAVDAAAEFERIVSRRGVVDLEATYPLALLQLARAKTAAGDRRGARAAYEQLLSLWRDADPDLPSLVGAREELAKLSSDRSGRGSR